MERKNIFDGDKPSGKRVTYYIVLGICVLVIGIASFLSYKSIQNAVNKPEQQTADLDESDRDAAQTEAPKTDVKEPEKKPEPETTEPEPQPEVEAKAYKMPLDGDITTGFSLDTPVYSVTLRDWRIHDGIDIAADVGSNVFAVNDGVVESIKTDDMFGVTVILRHTDGKKSMYSNLEDSVELEEGQIINRGDIVGKVGQTAIYELSDGPHLHFEMSADGEKIDPASVIK